MKEIFSYFNDLVALFFPELCTACGRNLYRNERVICTNCIYHLPLTNFHSDPENKMARQLWGRFPFVQTIAFLYFRKGSRIQNLMHQLKYKKNQETGIRLGELYAYDLKRSTSFKQADLIIPVPLHPSKLKKRGYNQSECIANGISSILNIPVSTNNLIRTENTETQTKKSRYARYENLINAFSIKDKSELINKHIMLVDDVLTTGATLEACSIKLLEIQGTKISICTLAFTE
jgi:ComF family protein